MLNTFTNDLLFPNVARLLLVHYNVDSSARNQLYKKLEKSHSCCSTISKGDFDLVT